MNVKFQNFDYKNKIAEQRILFDECFPEIKNLSSSSLAHYKWKHRGMLKSYEYSALLEKKLIGYYAALLYRYRYKNKYIKSGMVCDVMTGEKSRGKSVFTNIGKFATEDLKNNSLDITTGFPIRKEVIPGHLKAGWNLAFKLPLYFKINSSKSILQKFHLGAFYPLIDLLIKIISFPFNFVIPTKDLKVKEIDSLLFFKSQSYIDFNDKISNENLIYLNKNFDFFNWRLSAPNSEYKLYKISLKSKLVGYIITRHTIRHGIKCTGILDIVFLKNYSKYVKHAFSKIKVQSDLFLLMCNRRLYRAYSLNKCGFVKSTFSFHLIIKNLSNHFDNDLLFDEKNWHLTWLDSDDL